jgi:hypothetical protein
MVAAPSLQVLVLPQEKSLPMKKLLFAVIAAAGIAGSTLAYTAHAANEPPSAARMQQMQEERAAMLDARLAGLKAGLKLTSDQEKLWPPFEAAIRDAAKSVGDAMRQMRESIGMKSAERPSPIAHMEMMSDHMAKMSAELKSVAEAGKPLFEALNDSQKRSFGPLLHDLMRPPGHIGSQMGWWRHDRDEYGRGEIQ